MTSTGQCELCGRSGVRIERHHLIPKTRHANKKNKKRFDRREVHERIAMLCRPCHKTVHATLTEKQLEQEFNTLQALRSDPDLAGFVKWVRRQPPGAHVTVRSTRGKRDRTGSGRRPGR
jgi:hypothetical protein